MKEYIYETRILDANTNELVVKVSAFSLESLEEEMGKSKFTGAVERYETPEVFRTEELPQVSEEEPTLPEDNYDKEAEMELEEDRNEELKND